MAPKTMGASAPVCPQVAIYLAKGAYTADKTTTEGPFVGASKVPAVTALPASNTLQKGSYKVGCRGCCIGKKRLCGGPSACSMGQTTPDIRCPSALPPLNPPGRCLHLRCTGQLRSHDC